MRITTKCIRWIGIVLCLPLTMGPRLLGCTVIQGDRITGADLAQENLGFAAVDADLDLGPAPLAGTERVMRAFELQSLAQKLGLVLLESAPKTACFRRATQVLSEEMLLPLFKEALGEAATQIEIVDFNRHELPLGYVEFDRRGLSSSGLWRGRLVFAPNRSVPIWARVRITAPDGEPVAFWQQPNEPPAIRSGDTVRVQVTSGGVLLEFEADAQSNAHIGETVLVRNPANGQRFRATVEAPGQVSITP